MRPLPSRLAWLIGVCACTREPPPVVYEDRSEVLEDWVQWQIPAESGDATCDLLEQMGGGAATGDVDGDGIEDIFLARDGLPDALLFADGAGFTDRAASWGLNELDPSMSASLVDLDGDGALDLLIGSLYGRLRLYLQRSGAFVLEQEWTLGEGTECTGVFSMAVADVDGDEDLDLHVAVYEANAISASRLFINQGAGRLVDETVARGPDLAGVWAFTSAFADLDEDGDFDLLVAGDFSTSQLFINEDGQFVNATQGSGFATDENGMGLTLGDLNGDGHIDAFVTSVFESRECPSTWDCSGNRLLLGRGDGTFEDITEESGTRDGGWGWGAAMFDYDLDGHTDLAMTNGYPKPWPAADPDNDVTPFNADPTRLWAGPISDLDEVADAVGLIHTGPGRAFIPFDWGNDGDPDVLIIESGDSPALFENIREDSHWLKVRVRGSSANPSGIGARVRLQAEEDGPIQTAWVSHRSGFAGTGSAELLFGLDEQATSIFELRVRFPGQTDESVYLDLAVDRLFVAE